MKRLAGLIALLCLAVSTGGDAKTSHGARQNRVTFNGTPDLTLTMSRSGDFVPGGRGSYSLVVRNTGRASTIAPVTVSDILPSGLTPTAAAGTGWSCSISGQAVACSRTDALNANAGYPAISVIVDVAQDAPATLPVSATVSGGGEKNRSNNDSGILTIINRSSGPGSARSWRENLIQKSSSLVIAFLRFSSYLLFAYYTSTNVLYFLLLVSSIAATVAQHRRLATLWLDRLRTSSLAPPISILVPARNEEKSIVESVRSFLALDYPELEVVVVNDGSTDRTLEELRRHFDLLSTDILHVSEIPTQPIRAVYMSTRDARLLVLDKLSCGRKADALNAALNAASSPFVCAVDADAVLEKDALLRVMAPALTDPHRVIASGGIVRIVNGTTVEKGAVRQVKLPRRLIEVLQVVEYLRSFLIGRQGWAHFNLLTIISGAFGVFRRDICRQIGGFRTSAIGEDMDLIVRMHRHMRHKGEDYRVAFVPDPVCWTEAPSSYKSLARQRARWQNGLADVLWQNRKMLFNPRYGRIGLIALPYQWAFEFLAPAFEVFGWITMILAGLLGALSTQFFIQFLLFGYLFGTLISIGSVVIEEMTYHRYNDPRDLLRMIAVCFMEHIPYRPLNSFWRLRGMWEFVTGKNSWQMIDRVGFASQPGGA